MESYQSSHFPKFQWNPTVDGSEIRWSPVEVGSLSVYPSNLPSFYTSQVVETRRISEPSGQIIIFHQPRFPWNKGISLP